ncbi:hypothetical protein B0181_07245 [Moraxella caviae]|uniref:Uncharacterized protein n=1 Tax=Moraxella caviae TaxID=34060 RepID=A0A1T0A144_9GAMM|nr:hypothetical protein [Moraxella caviae]OOR89462.1 hypothetical protein B0181_07245 [Moraxella caviae]STZ09812.1 Uncharacterised protein [Moraxella caviae]
MTTHHSSVAKFFIAVQHYMATSAVYALVFVLSVWLFTWSTSFLSANAPYVWIVSVFAAQFLTMLMIGVIFPVRHDTHAKEGTMYHKLAAFGVLAWFFGKRAFVLLTNDASSIVLSAVFTVLSVALLPIFVAYFQYHAADNKAIAKGLGLLMVAGVADVALTAFANRFGEGILPVMTAVFYVVFALSVLIFVWLVRHCQRPIWLDENGAFLRVLRVILAVLGVPLVAVFWWLG